MPNMLAMAAFQFGYPVLFFVLMESNNSLFHQVGSRQFAAARGARPGGARAAARSSSVSVDSLSNAGSTRQRSACAFASSCKPPPFSGFDQCAIDYLDGAAGGVLLPRETFEAGGNLSGR